jgi:hypothetical protein
MKRYKQLIRETDSLSELTDTTIPSKIVEFLMKNPFPKDHEQFHKFAEDELKIDSDKLEQYVYAMLTVILTGGKSKGDTTKISKDQLDIGLKIEMEHVNLENDNKVIKEIQRLFALKISSDHNSEKNDYYTSTINFEDELKQEGK